MQGANRIPSQAIDIAALIRGTRHRYRELRETLDRTNDEFAESMVAILEDSGMHGVVEAFQDEMSLPPPVETESEEDEVHQMSRRTIRTLQGRVQRLQHAGLAEMSPPAEDNQGRNARLDRDRRQHRNVVPVDEVHCNVAFQPPQEVDNLESASQVASPQNNQQRLPAYRRPSMYGPSVQAAQWNTQVHGGSPSVINGPSAIHASTPNELAFVGPIAGPRDGIGVQRLLNMIQELVGDAPTSDPPAYLKMAKLPPPKTYEGKDDPDQFEVWLRGLLEYFNMLHIMGPQYDADRLRMLSSSLSGNAATWFYNTVQSPSRDKRDWMFEEAIMGLFRRFVHRDTHLQAEQQFAALRFDASKGGVAGLYECMLYLANKMWEYPTEFQMRKKFIEALPEQYESILSLYKGMSPQCTTLYMLYQSTLELEQNMRALQLRKCAQDAGGSTTPPVNTMKSSSDNRLVRANSASQHQSSACKTASSRFKSVNRAALKQTIQVGPSCIAGQVLRLWPTWPLRIRSEVPPVWEEEHFGPTAHVRATHHDETSDKEGSPQLEGTGEDARGDNESPVLEDAPADVVDDDQEYPPSDYGGSQYESEREDELSPVNDNNKNDLFFGGMQIAPFKELLGELVHAHSMAIQPDRNLRHAWLYNAKVRKIQDPAAQPKRDKLSQPTFSAEISVNGVMALALFDSGCTTDSITPELVYVCKANRVDLKKPVGLQLGTKGSRTRINYGARAMLQVGKLKQSQYLDVVDINKYDLILGTMFCCKHNVMLDFTKDQVLVDGERVALFWPEPQVDRRGPKKGMVGTASCGPTTPLRGVKFGVAANSDPHGVNKLIDRIAAEQWEDEIIRWTHVGFVIDEKEEELQKLRDKWYAKTEDIMRSLPETLSPCCEVNHRIPLIDKQKKYQYHLPRCADVVKLELLTKINRCVAAGWWRPVTCEQAAPLLCVTKKDGKLPTVVDARQRNSNMVHDLTPFPDQDLIRMDMARAKYRSKIDLS
ncbi:hypothetical protein NUW54_g8816 [Trametes sanguinea]|uniref:Uncharacterized protein n=1 Tax=Trametes sanguinea TaxID=158606 RepID=A0ACC1PC98_9APHY|nr:hypothetical protein NUW54_g8816 [Trametes sanguinea]